MQVMMPKIGMENQVYTYIIERSEFMITMSKVTFIAHLAIIVLLKVSATLSFILKVYISIIISICSIIISYLYYHIISIYLKSSTISSTTCPFYCVGLCFSFLIPYLLL